eukprot:TRINITY_DN3364_c0_g1_i1.p1 TRINITY_DN3364_c0_g1~~TRINITY_DN3364_c0_g1_i1.p1  ORF type:complete len:240 (+),score=100.74 TRINITY_DN3364_c0_g1_i1:216-935(+)
MDNNSLLFPEDLFEPSSFDDATDDSGDLMQFAPLALDEPMRAASLVGAAEAAPVASSAIAIKLEPGSPSAPVAGGSRLLPQLSAADLAGQFASLPPPPPPPPLMVGGGGGGGGSEANWPARSAALNCGKSRDPPATGALGEPGSSLIAIADDATGAASAAPTSDAARIGSSRASGANCIKSPLSSVASSNDDGSKRSSGKSRLLLSIAFCQRHAKNEKWLVAEVFGSGGCVEKSSSKQV